MVNKYIAHFFMHSWDPYYITYSDLPTSSVTPTLPLLHLTISNSLLSTVNRMQMTQASLVLPPPPSPSPSPLPLPFPPPPPPPPLPCLLPSLSLSPRLYTLLTVLHLSCSGFRVPNMPRGNGMDIWILYFTLLYISISQDGVRLGVGA